MSSGGVQTMDLSKSNPPGIFDATFGGFVIVCTKEGQLTSCICLFFMCWYKFQYCRTHPQNTLHIPPPFPPLGVFQMIGLD